MPERVRYKICLLVFKAVHGARLSEWALPIKYRRHCSFSTPLSSTWWSSGSTSQDQLLTLCVCSCWASIMEQTTSNNLVIWFTAEFQDPTKCSLFLMDRSFFSIHLEYRRCLNWRFIIIAFSHLETLASDRKSSCPLASRQYRALKNNELMRCRRNETYMNLVRHSLATSGAEQKTDIAGQIGLFAYCKIHTDSWWWDLSQWWLSRNILMMCWLDCC